MPNSNSQTIVDLTAGGRGVGEVLAELVRDLARSYGLQAESGAQLTAQMEDLRAASQAQANAAANEKAKASSSSSSSSNSSSKDEESTASKVGKNLGKYGVLSPVLTGILSLFGGGGDKEEPPLTMYSRPESIAFEGAIVRSQAGEELGFPWAGPVQAAPTSGTAPSGNVSSESQTPAAQAASNPQITIQVQAMDSRSFMDHRDDIARAVRDAMLNSHSLNDVVSDL